MLILINRSNQVDFTNTVHSRKFLAIFRQPDLTVDVFSKQFSPMLWRLWFIMVGFLAITMILMVHFARQNDKESYKSSSDFGTFPNILSWIFCLISQQGFEEMPCRLPARMVYFLGFVFGMLCFMGFQANIVTTFTTSNFLKDIEELIDYSIETSNINNS